MWSVCPLILGFILLMFAWVPAMIFRMENDDEIPSWRRMVAWHAAGGVLLAMITLAFPREPDCAALNEIVFGCATFLMAVEYRRVVHAWPSVTDVGIGVTCAVATAAPIAVGPYVECLFEPGWTMEAWASVTVLMFLFLDFTR